ncbi:hypothetical protein BN1110_03264 [bacterium YEK0313]|nr:hypothetical protein BN1110_03264 [bacterium YEK0313]
MSLIDGSTRQFLSSLYAEPGRFYHGLDHIASLLALARANRARIDDSDAVEAAIWFHDAVYDAKRSDNEALSAALARERLAGRCEARRLARIATMIEATAGHEPPVFGDAAAEHDAALFLDMDLAILGAAPATFDAYEAAVRREYAHVPDADWRAGRAAVLRRFLAREAIYRTAIFRSDREQAARDNLRRSLERLADGGAA